MKTGKTLTQIALIGTLVLGVAGCSRGHSQYKYDGKIGEDHVEFIEKSNGFGVFYDDNILTITKPDGRVIEFKDDWKEDLKFEHIYITDGYGNTIEYSSYNEVGKYVVEEAKKQSNIYLEKILEKKAKIKKDRINREIKQGLEDLK